MATSAVPTALTPRYVTLTPLSLTTLPLSSPSELEKILRDIIDEASAFVSSVIPDDDPASATYDGIPVFTSSTTGGWKYLGEKKTQGWLNGRVDVLEKDIGKEKWLARRSLHPEIGHWEADGAIEWAEFVDALLRNHFENEGNYVETLKKVEKVWEWKESGNGVGEIGCAVYLLAHHIAPPLSQRIFPILLVTSQTTDTSFIVVSLPVVRWENLDPSAETRKIKGVLARYVAVERVRVLGNTARRNEWVMATSSEAGGIVPKFVERLALPGVVAKDVGWFLRWIQKKRESGEGL